MPTEIHWTDDYEDKDAAKERLFDLMEIADANSWVMTCSILKKMKDDLKNNPSETVLRDRGLRNIHSYTIIDTKEVKLDDGSIEKLLFLRNPTGNFYCKDHEIWNGDWAPLSDKWTESVRK